MYNLRRFFYQNRNQIIKTIAIIIFIFFIIQMMNYFVRKNSEKETVNKNQNITIKDEDDKGLISEKSAVTGKDVSDSKLDNATTVINEFISFCNQQDLEKAYNLLTNECKEQMYTSLDIFRQAYYNDVFNGEKKIFTIENWIDDTYKVNITGDLLATGKNDGYAKQDYITVKEENDQCKLNINGYIGYSNINKKTTKDNITMEVISKNTYKEYEEYTIKVTNNTDYELQLDSVNSTKTLYLEDSKGGKYSYYNHELTQPTLTVKQGQEKEISIKFYSSYISTKKIKYVVFSNIIANKGQLSEKMEFKANT